MLMKMIWSMRMMISFPELQEKWDKITNTAENYILVSGDHTLSFHIGYNNLKQRSFVVYNTGKIDDIPNSKSISAKCINADSGIFFTILVAISFTQRNVYVAMLGFNG